MSTEYEDRISTQSLTLQDSDLAEEEAEYASDAYRNSDCWPNPKKSTERELTERLVDQLRGRSPLVGRKRVDV